MTEIPQWAKECAQEAFREEAEHNGIRSDIGALTNNPPAWAAMDALARYIAWGGIEHWDYRKMVKANAPLDTTRT